MIVLREGCVKARKSHDCDGIDQIDRKYGNEVLAGFKCLGIPKGDKYYIQVNTYDGFGTFKCCKNCWDFIIKEGLYDE